MWHPIRAAQSYDRLADLARTRDVLEFVRNVAGWYVDGGGGAASVLSEIVDDIRRAPASRPRDPRDSTSSWAVVFPDIDVAGGAIAVLDAPVGNDGAAAEVLAHECLTRPIPVHVLRQPGDRELLKNIMFCVGYVVELVEGGFCAVDAEVCVQHDGGDDGMDDQACAGRCSGFGGEVELEDGTEAGVGEFIDGGGGHDEEREGGEDGDSHEGRLKAEGGHGDIHSENFSPSISSRSSA
jgi:hypothetical protein